tara:strand:+ start:2482 stop:2889 length:408 start_codon:yes stop_codon:yes gene_type:complete
MKEYENMMIKCIEKICGLYATNDYSEGDLLFVLKGKYLKKPTKHSIQIDEQTHILDKMGKYMNHSFEPNCSINGYDVVALKDIKEADELNIIYNTKENPLSLRFAWTDNDFSPIIYLPPPVFLARTPDEIMEHDH